MFVYLRYKFNQFERTPTNLKSIKDSRFMCKYHSLKKIQKKIFFSKSAFFRSVKFIVKLIGLFFFRFVNLRLGGDFVTK